MSSAPSPAPGSRSGLLATTEGSRPDAFGRVEWGLLVATAAIWGSSYLWIELALRTLEPGVITTARIALGVLAVAVIPRARRPIDATDRWRIVLLGAGWFALPMITFPIAQDLGVSTSVVGLLNGALPILTTLSASVLLRRRPRTRAQIGLLIGFAGLAAVSWPQLRGADATAAGVWLILGSMAVVSLLVNMLVPLQQRYGALPVLFRAQLVALAVALPFGLYGLPASELSMVSVLALLPLGLLSTGLAFTTWVTLVGRTGASRGAVVSYLVPIVAVALGVVVLHERISWAEGLGAVGVLVGAWLLSSADQPSR